MTYIVLENMNVVNIALEAAGVMLCILGIILVRLGAKLNTETSRYFIIMFTFLMLELLSNIAGLVARGKPGMIFRVIVGTANFGEYLFGILLVAASARYLFYLTDPERKRKILRQAAVIIPAAEIVTLIISQFTGLYYYIDKSNVYHRSEHYWVIAALNAAALLIDLLILICGRKKLSPREMTAYLVYLISPLTALIIQPFVYGIFIILFATMFSAFIMFIIILIDRTEDYYRQQKENMEMRVAVAISRIQPHFLYNALGTVKYYCRIEPETAAEAVDELSVFFRACIGSLDFEKNIWFNKELEATRAYLAIEKKRFGDSLNIEYDIRANDFCLPPMSLQPIVENSVKYGIRNKGKVTVRISSYRNADNNYIVISDDGGGFDAGKIKNDGRAHIGIENVKKRIELMCGGTLELKSEPGKGTEVRLIIHTGGNME